MFTVVKPCRSCKSYVLKPNEEITTDIENLKELIEKNGYDIIAFTGTLLSVKKDCKVNIYKSGKITIVTKDENLVMKVKEELSNILYPYTKAVT